MQNKIITILSFLVLACLSCKKFLDVGPPKDTLVPLTVFNNNELATSAVTGTYTSMANGGFASGNPQGITAICGRSADEFINFNSAFTEFYEAKLSPSNSTLTGLYGQPYTVIYTANAVIEGLQRSGNVSAPVRRQLEGEAHFIRAFSYFYLVNLFGAVPLNLTTDYQQNQKSARSPVGEVYAQVVRDLRLAEEQLAEEYISTERVRPNRAAAQALLARTYLFMGQWEDAERYASLVIARTGTYGLVGLDNVFLKNSQEAIWQLMPPSSNSNTLEGTLFILTSIPQQLSLSSSLVNEAFEVDDKRKTSWMKAFTDNTGTYYYPFKYKVRQSTTVSEYSMVLRVAEQYLIRAEARINMGKIDLGIADLNVLRSRARPLPTVASPNPLPPFQLTLNKPDALLAVEKERRRELFAEWGHRWLDLKRTARAQAVLSPLKPGWQPADVLYPIPNGEINRNRNITQNDGY